MNAGVKESLEVSSKIMDVTLRDGSYAINFGFTASDTRIIAGALEAAGFRLIEIGHGIGLSASRKGFGAAAAADDDYLKAAAETLKKAKFGMFCIPGIAELDDIRMAADYQMGFVRIGTNVTEMESAKPFVELAKNHGMMVCCNFMKSYALPPDEFALKAKLAQDFGADIIYFVDSAGGMLPDQIAKYLERSIAVGVKHMAFHGHNNLGMAEANSLMALKCGAKLIDTSLQGIGRSSGNTVAERMLPILELSGFKYDIDLIKTMDIGEKYVRPLLRGRGLSSLDMIAGAAQFHSSYMHIIRDSALHHEVDPRLLILKLCAIDKINCPAPLVEALARELPRMNEDGISAARFNFNDYFGHEQG